MSLLLRLEDPALCWFTRSIGEKLAALTGHARLCRRRTSDESGTHVVCKYAPGKSCACLARTLSVLIDPHELIGAAWRPSVPRLAFCAAAMLVLCMSSIDGQYVIRE